MKERPILFSAPMVRAILAGTKAQTRRAMKPQPSEDFRVLAVEWYSPEVTDRHGDLQPSADIFGVYGDEEGYKCPYGAPGDRLWVRETFSRTNPGGDYGVYFYRAEEFYPDILYRPPRKIDSDIAWTPSIFMPRIASRINLDITGVRVEQLQAISATDAWAEGIPHSPDVNPRHEYEELWNTINGPAAWDANPWVWVVEFKRTE